MHNTPTFTTRLTYLLLVVVGVLMVLLVLQPAMAFPATVTDASTICNGIITPSCNVAAATTLDVDAMTTNANLASSTSALFETEDMAFSDGLTIDCTAATVWTHGANLIVRIINANTATTTVPYFVFVRGPLQLASSITIKGGSYDYNSNYCSLIRFVTTSAILDSSSISVTYATITAKNVDSATYLPFLVFYSLYDNTVIDDGSSLTIDHNTLQIENCTTPAVTGFAWLMFYTDKNLQVSRHSFVSMYNNTATITVPSFSGGIIRFRGIQPGQHLIIIDHSSVNISEFNVAMSDSAMVSGSFMLAAVTTKDLVMNGSSALNILNNNFSVADVLIVGEFYWNHVNFTGTVAISDSCTVNISGNTNAALRVSVQGPLWRWNLVTNAITFSLTDGSTFEVSDNVCTLQDVLFTATLQWSLIWWYNGTLLSNSSSVLEYRNAITMTNISGVVFTYRLMYIVAAGGDVTIQDNSHLILSTFNAVLSDVRVTTRFDFCSLWTVSAPLSVLDSSSLVITDNNLFMNDSVMFYFIWQVVEIIGRITASQSSQILLNANTMSVHNFQIYYNNWVFVYAFRGISASQNSTVEMNDNIFNTTNNSVTGPMSLHLLYSVGIYTIFSDFSEFSVRRNLYILANHTVAHNFNIPNVVMVLESQIVNHSTVTVQDNTFNYTDVRSGWGTTPFLIQVNPGFTISNNSAFQIVSNRYTISNYSDNSTKMMGYIFFTTTSPLKISDNSILNITDQTYLFTDTVMPEAVLSTMSLFHSEGLLDVSSNSVMILRNNVRRFERVTYLGPFVWNMFETSGEVNITSDSSITISQNAFALVDATVQQNNWQGFVCSLLKVDDGSGGGGSTINISHNALEMTNVLPPGNDASSTISLINTTAGFMVPRGRFTATYNTLPVIATPLRLWTLTSPSAGLIRTCGNVVGSTKCQTNRRGEYTCLEDAAPLVLASDCHGTDTLSPTSTPSLTSPPTLTATARMTSTPTHSLAPTDTSSLPSTRTSSPSTTIPNTNTPTAPLTSSPSPSQTAPTYTGQTHSLTPPNTTTATPTSLTTHTLSPKTTTQTPSHTLPLMANRITPTTTTTAIIDVPPLCSPSAIATSISEMPLFNSPITVAQREVVSGFTMTLRTRIAPLNASYLPLLAANSTSSSPSSSSGLRGITVELQQESVAGNTMGFASIFTTTTSTPTTAAASVLQVLLINTTHIEVRLEGVPSYNIFEKETLLIYISTEYVSFCNTSLLPSSRVIIGRIIVDADTATGTSTTSVTGTVIGGGVGVIGVGLGAAAIASDQIGLSALSMFTCADPHTRAAFGSYRLLSPFAVYESYAGVIIGNVLSIFAVAMIQGVVLIILRLCRPTRRRIELMALGRFPAVLINISLAFQTGTAFAASQLISQSDRYDTWEVVIGAIAFLYIVAYPVFLSLHPYLQIERAYQKYELSEWASSWPRWIRVLMPGGAVYSTETRAAYGYYVSAYRAPATQVWWTSYPTWTSIIIGLGGLFHPETIPKCQAVFGMMGGALLVVAVVVAASRPFRSVPASLMDAAAKVLLAGVVFAMVVGLSFSSSSSKSAANSAEKAQFAVVILGILLMVLTLVRIIHALVCLYFDWYVERDQIPLTTVWSHIPPGTSSSTSRTFAASEDLKEEEAAHRDTSPENDDDSGSAIVPFFDSKNNSNINTKGEADAGGNELLEIEILESNEEHSNHDDDDASSLSLPETVVATGGGEHDALYSSSSSSSPRHEVGKNVTPQLSLQDYPKKKHTYGDRDDAPRRRPPSNSSSFSSRSSISSRRAGNGHNNQEPNANKGHNDDNDEVGSCSSSSGASLNTEQEVVESSDIDMELL